MHWESINNNFHLKRFNLENDLNFGKNNGRHEKSFVVLGKSKNWPFTSNLAGH